MNHFAKLKYFRDILDLKETTSDVQMCINRRTLLVNFTVCYCLQLKFLPVKFTNTFHVQKMQIRTFNKKVQAKNYEDWTDKTFENKKYIGKSDQ